MEYVLDNYNAHPASCRGHCPAYRGHMPGFRWSSRRSLTCAALCLLFGCLQLPLGEAVTPLTSWQSGIATNYGGPLDGKNPYDPSWGTITVSPSSHEVFCRYYKVPLRSLDAHRHRTEKRRLVPSHTSECFVAAEGPSSLFDQCSERIYTGGAGKLWVWKAG